MIIRFNKEMTYGFNLKNSNSLTGCIGLYFIFLNDLIIPYPIDSSKLIYIGMSESKVNSIGNRLKSHIKGHSKNKGIIGYSKNWSLIFTYLDHTFLKHLFPSNKIEAIETYFLENFADEYGAYPICNNKRGILEETPKLTYEVLIDWSFFKESK